MMQIPTQEMLLSLEEGYKEYKKSKAEGKSEVVLAHIKGFCTTLEQILSVYGGVSAEEMMKIKEPILGNESLRMNEGKGNKIDLSADFDEPTIFRKNK
ncbi:MAG: hypothetical protein QG617_1794 [Campylobacterota bacterium]|nr:hypothetical protein [Campylobacterota bacterium]